MKFILLPVLALLTGAAQAVDPVTTTVFTSGKEGYHTYRIPSVLLTPKGTLLAFCEGRKTGRGDHGDLDLILKRSSDNGETWGPLELVHEEGGSKKVTIGNPCPVVDQTTRTIWLPFNRDNDDVLITHSTDDGRTWSKPRIITDDVKDPAWGWYAAGPGVGIQLRHGPHKGRLIIPCDHRIKGKTSLQMGGGSHTIYSDDHGKTWQLGKPTQRGMNECQVVELADGRLLLNMRSYLKHGCRSVAFSKDGGVSWSPIQDADALIEPVCQASLISFAPSDATEPFPLVFSNPASTNKRHQLTVRLSTDAGKTWPASRVLHAGPAAYSCLVTLPSAEIGCLYEAGEKHAYETIRFSRFPRAWIGRPSPAKK
ncbi:MAG: glycosyl hydrolase [Planctomycetaceae bacterium]|nr:glycosyl hydrolase [Planctomycetaceae bacterium]